MIIAYNCHHLKVIWCQMLLKFFLKPHFNIDVNMQDMLAPFKSFKFEIVKNVKDQTEVSANSRLSRNTWQRIKSKILQTVFIWHWWLFTLEGTKVCKICFGRHNSKVLKARYRKCSRYSGIVQPAASTEPYKCMNHEQNKIKRSWLWKKKKGKLLN